MYGCDIVARNQSGVVRHRRLYQLNLAEQTYHAGQFSLILQLADYVYPCSQFAASPWIPGRFYTYHPAQSKKLQE